jgi:BirA family transcriptional regulator, biotin operon repressor / biotin---[acetyl-CoA-carboxylase] ligase
LNPRNPPSPHPSAALARSPRPLPDDLASSINAAGDRLGVFAHRQFLWYESVPSTNDLAAALAERGAREGCAVIADAQSAGRGRQGRPWSSPAGAGIYVSTILRPPTHALALLTIAAGVAVAEAVQSSTGLDPQLKWPNDVYLGERKVAGLLAEAGSLEEGPEADEGGADRDGPRLTYVVLGIGINVMRAAHPADIAVRASSLEEELGRSVDRGLLLTACFVSLAARYEQLLHGRTEGILSAWRARSQASFGRPVEFDAGGARRGIAEGIDDSGALLVRTDTGVERIISGEVRWT